MFIRHLPEIPDGGGPDPSMMRSRRNSGISSVDDDDNIDSAVYLRHRNVMFVAYRL